MFEDYINKYIELTILIADQLYDELERPWDKGVNRTDKVVSILGVSWACRIRKGMYKEVSCNLEGQSKAGELIDEIFFDYLEGVIYYEFALVHGSPEEMMNLGASDYHKSIPRIISALEQNPYTKDNNLKASKVEANFNLDRRIVADILSKKK